MGVILPARWPAELGAGFELCSWILSINIFILTINHLKGCRWRWSSERLIVFTSPPLNPVMCESYNGILPRILVNVFRFVAFLRHHENSVKIVIIGTLETSPISHSLRIKYSFKKISTFKIRVAIKGCLILRCLIVRLFKGCAIYQCLNFRVP